MKELNEELSKVSCSLLKIEPVILIPMDTMVSLVILLMLLLGYVMAFSCFQMY